MRRLLSTLAVLAALAPGVAVLSMANHTPKSAFVVPAVQIATTDGPVRLSPDELGVTRTRHGLNVDDELFDAQLQAIVSKFGEPAVPGGYELTKDGVRLKSGTPGLALDYDLARAQILKAMETARGNVTLPIRQVEASAAPRFAIVVNLSKFRLQLYEGTQLVKHYAVGVGALKFPTPPGAYYIKSKSVNPTWRNPNSAWSKSMPAYIGPGPKNPLGTRALRLDRGALVIHGTPNPGSVGQRSSHGCIRMRNAEVQDLFERVPTGTEVFIIP